MPRLYLGALGAIVVGAALALFVSAVAGGVVGAVGMFVAACCDPLSGPGSEV